MERFYTTSRVKELEAEELKQWGCGVEELIERAVTALSAAISRHTHPDRMDVWVGPGNNGADGRGLASRLIEAGCEVRVLDAFKELTLERVDESAPLVIDAVFGHGFRRPLPEPIRAVFRRARERGLRIWSIDLPSGLSGHDGEADADAIRAERIFELGAPKLANALRANADYVGAVEFLDLGFPRELVPGDIASLEASDLSAQLKARAPTSNKYSFGRLQIFAGSPRYPGAALLCARAALKAGCGAVHLETSARDAALRELPELILGVAESADAVVFGPGLETEGVEGDENAARLRAIWKDFRPLVVDGGGLRLLARIAREQPLSARPGPVILTPHDNEAKALLKALKIEAAPRILALKGLAERLPPRSAALWKGLDTLVAGSSEGPVWLNRTGSVAQASAGQGDVLSGILGSLLAAGHEAVEAAALAAYLHGRAGDELAQGGSLRQGVLAHEVADALPRVWAGFPPKNPVKR